MEGELLRSSETSALVDVALRRTANYEPTLWDDSYIQSLPDGLLDEEQFNLLWKLEKKVRYLINHNKQKDIIERLEFIDVLRQLGISYHFEGEIKSLLSSKALSMESLGNKLNNSLHGSALLFRLLREYDIKIPNLSSDFLIKSYKNESGSLKTNITNDVKGLLSLYEASYLAIEGEDELEEAQKFTYKHLSKYLKEALHINHSLVEQMCHALELPMHWRMSRLHSRWFIDAYERQENMNPVLLEFAKLDFNMLQNVYKKELKELSRWWKSLGLTGDDFSFARDRLLENYFWILGSTFEPHFWRCRKEITKIGCLITTIDDIYDVYGSLEELVLFTDVVDGWKIDEVEQLPNYMRIALTALFNTMNDIACVFLTEKGLDILPQLKRLWGNQCKAYLVEAIWHRKRYTPTLNEYMENAWLTIAAPLVLTTAYCLSEDLTLEALNNLEFYPKVTRYSSIITRLCNDLGTSTDEVQRGDVPKSVQCYMKEANVSESIARDHIKYLIQKYWKLLNSEYSFIFNKEESFKRFVLSIPRGAQYIYQNGDGFGKPSHDTKDKIISSLIKAIP